DAMTHVPPDLEFNPPEPVSDAALREGSEGSMRTRARATPLQVVVSALPPGGGPLLRGEWVGGASLLLIWGALLGVVQLSSDEIGAMLVAQRRPADGLVATATLAMMLVGCWGWPLYDLLVRTRRQVRLRGDSQWAIAA